MPVSGGPGLRCAVQSPLASPEVSPVGEAAPPEAHKAPPTPTSPRVALD